MQDIVTFAFNRAAEHCARAHNQTRGNRVRKINPANPFIIRLPSLKKDDARYYLLTSEHVSVSEFEGQEILKVAPEALTLLARQAFMMRRLCCVRLTNNRWPTFCVTRRPAKMINMWRCNSCVTPTSRRKAFCQPVRIPALRLLLVKGQRCMDRWL